MSWFDLAQPQLHHPVAFFEKIVLWSDVCGSKRMEKSLPREEYEAIIAGHYAIVFQTVVSGTTGIELLEPDGDAVYILFGPENGIDAINAAIQVQETISAQKDPLAFRCSIGLTVGDLSFTNGRFDGAPRHLAHSMAVKAGERAIFIQGELSERIDKAKIRSTQGDQNKRTGEDYLGDLRSDVFRDFHRKIPYYELLWSTERYGTKT